MCASVNIPTFIAKCIFKGTLGWFSVMNITEMLPIFATQWKNCFPVIYENVADSATILHITQPNTILRT